MIFYILCGFCVLRVVFCSGKRQLPFSGAVLLSLAALTKQSDGGVLFSFGCIYVVSNDDKKFRKMMIFSVGSLITALVVFLPF